MKRIRKFFRRQKFKIIKFLDRITGGLFREADLRSAKRKLELTGDVLDGEKVLLSRVSTRVHYNDQMYVPEQAQHYLSVGLSAIRCINGVLEKSGKNKVIRSILDFPCGHGRVLRFLRVRFPDADITASEIDDSSLDFCGREFSVKTVKSDKDFSKVPLSGKFDLIWCGSLITHLDEKATTDLLRFFHGLLAHDGLLVFTTHGPSVAEKIQKGSTGPLTDDLKDLLFQFREKGYGYADYKNQKGYGNSLVTRERMLEIAQSVGRWNNILYLERGWADNQDVFGYSMPDK